MANGISGNNNTALGHTALVNNSAGHGNTGIGKTTLFSNTKGSYRTALGYSANSNGTTYNNSTGLGYNTDPTAANQVRLGNSSVTSIGGYSDWTNISDGRFKQNVREDVKGLEFIKLLRPVNYTLDQYAIDDYYFDHYQERDTANFEGKYDASLLMRTGFIAQEVEAAALAVGFDFYGVDKPKNTDDFYGLRYASFLVPLVKAVQEQQVMIEEQRAMIESLILTVQELQNE